MKFDIIWEYCIQEEARVANIEALLREHFYGEKLLWLGVPQQTA